MKKINLPTKPIFIENKNFQTILISIIFPYQEKITDLAKQTLLPNMLLFMNENYQTEDMTSFFSKVDGNVEDLKKAKRKRIYVLFLFLLGFAGADYFYLGFWKKGTICAVISFLLFALFSVCFYFIPGVEFLSILIGFLLILLLSFIRGFLALRKETFDVTGETLIE